MYKRLPVIVPDTTYNTPKNCLYYCNYSVFTL